MIDQSLRDKLADAYYGLIPLISLNIIWFVCCLPLVTAIPATAALFYATNRLAHGDNADWRTFFQGFRLYFWRSWLWGLLNLFAGVVLVSNFIFVSSQVQGTLRVWASAGVVVLAFLWLALQLYTFPLILEQQEPRLLLALRNSLIALVKRPVRTVGITLLVLALALVSTLVLAPLWVFITGSVCAWIANRAALAAITAITGRQASGSAIEPAAAPDVRIDSR